MKLKKLIVFLVVLMITMIGFSGCGINKDENKFQDVEGAKIENAEDNNKNQSTEVSEASCGEFVEHNGELYYWKLSSNSRKTDGLYGIYERVKNSQNTLVKRDTNGNEVEVFKDAGFGKICLTNDKIFYELESDNGAKVFSRDYSGNNKKEYTIGSIKFAVGKYLYVQLAYDIVAINLEDDSVNTVMKNAEIIGKANNYVYYRITGKEAIDALKTGIIINGEDNGIKATFNASEYKSGSSSQDRNVTFVEFKYENNVVNITLGDIQGTAHFIQEGYILQMNADGSNVSKKELQTGKDGPEGLLDVSEYSVKYENGELVYTNPKNGEKSKLMSDDELSSNFGFTGYSKDEEYTVSVYTANQNENDLFIVLDNGKHYEQGDIGWRYSYKREKTVAFKYNLNSKEIEKIYEF